MIRYTLKCEAGHGFDSWFANAAAYGLQQEKALVACPICGTTRVDKDLMAPNVRPARMTGNGAGNGAGRAAGGLAASVRSDVVPNLAEPASAMEAAIAAMRKHIEERSDYVGLNFAAEARRMHAGDVPERAIHGEARAEEARQLLEDGIPVAPLPFLPLRKVN